MKAHLVLHVEIIASNAGSWFEQAAMIINRINDQALGEVINAETIDPAPGGPTS